MLDAVQAWAGGKHPARENPLHFALQGDLIDLDEGVGVGGFGASVCTLTTVVSGALQSVSQIS